MADADVVTVLVCVLRLDLLLYIPLLACFLRSKMQGVFASLRLAAQAMGYATPSLLAAFATNCFASCSARRRWQAKKV
jgi:hypothetical protein